MIFSLPFNSSLTLNKPARYVHVHSTLPSASSRQRTQLDKLALHHVPFRVSHWVTTLPTRQARVQQQQHPKTKPANKYLVIGHGMISPRDFHEQNNSTRVSQEIESETGCPETLSSRRYLFKLFFSWIVVVSSSADQLERRVGNSAIGIVTCAAVVTSKALSLSIRAGAGAFWIFVAVVVSCAILPLVIQILLKIF